LLFCGLTSPFSALDQQKKEKRKTMTRTALIQKRYSDDSDWWSDGCDSAAVGFKKLGYKLKGFTSENIEKAPLAKTRPVRGSIYAVRRALELLGVPQPGNRDIPDCLKPFAGREIWTSTLQAVRHKNEPVFIKPLLIQKGFEGHIFHGNKGSPFSSQDYQTHNLPGNYKVLCQEPVKWFKEWRIYILHGEIVGTREYEPNTTPDRWSQLMRDNSSKPNYHTVRKMLSALGKEAPAGFSLDVGMMYHKEGTFLVEMNEGFSLGNYGIPNKTYARIIEARWDELVKRK